MGILEEVPGEDLNRIFITFPGVSFQGVVSTDWLVPRHRSGSLVTAAGPDVSHGIAPPGLDGLLCLELKHNRGLDVILQQLMLKGEVVQGFVWWSCEVIFQPNGQ